MARPLLAAFCVMLVACMAAPAAAQGKQYPNFWAAITANPQLKSMANFVTGDMKGALQNPKLAPFTIFAPTDAAFNAMLNANIPGIDIKAAMSNQAILSMVLNIHLASGTYPTSKMFNGQVIQSRLGGSAGALTVQKSGSNIKIQSVGQTPNIIEADIKAGDNGILHVIDGMLIPTKLPAGTSIPSGRRL